MEKVNPVFAGFPECVFLVDDDPDLSDLVGETIRDLGLACQVFDSADKAYDALAASRCFLVISDYRMKGMNGLEFCRKLREARPDLPFVLMTGFSNKEINVNGQQLGVTEFLEKPFELRDLKALVTRYAQARKTELESDFLETAATISLFLEEASAILEDVDPLILRLEERPLDPLVVDSLFRKIHTLKSGAGATGGLANKLGELAHVIESDLAAVRQGTKAPEPELVNRLISGTDLCRKLLRALKAGNEPGADLVLSVDQYISRRDEKWAASPGTQPADLHLDEDGLWVTNEKLDSLMKVSGELVVLKNNFHTLSRDSEARTNARRLEKRLQDLAFAIGKLTDHLQDEIMEVRKIRLDRTFGQVHVIARQLAAELHKKVQVHVSGGEIGIDKSIAKALSISLTHMVRNCVDHGLETPEERVALGKSPIGTIRISVQETHGIILCAIEDDGRGIDRARVLEKAIARGLVPEHQKDRLTPHEIFDLIFLPGFSTADTVSSVSGRGVGMDAIKSSVATLHGKVGVESTPGAGTRVLIEIPMPKSVMIDQTILVSTGARILAIPLAAVAHIAPLRDLTLCQVNGVTTCQFEGKTIPIGTYRQLMKVETRGDVSQAGKTVLILRHKSGVAGLVIEEILGQLEAVVKPFDGVVKHVPGFKGTADLGDDRIGYVLQPEEFIKIALSTTGDVQLAQIGAAS